MRVCIPLNLKVREQTFEREKSRETKLIVRIRVFVSCYGSGVRQLVFKPGTFHFLPIVRNLSVSQFPWVHSVVTYTTHLWQGGGKNELHKESPWMVLV